MVIRSRIEGRRRPYMVCRGLEGPGLHEPHEAFVEQVLAGSNPPLESAQPKTLEGSLEALLSALGSGSFLGGQAQRVGHVRAGPLPGVPAPPLDRPADQSPLAVGVNPVSGVP